MSASRHCRQGYALLNVSGKDEGLKHARRELSARWAKAARPATVQPEPT